MKALIMFKSHYGNTRQVAEAIARGLGGQGVECAVVDLRQKPRTFDGFDAVLVGAPTRMGRATYRALSVLRRLAKKGWGAKPVAVFDTYGPLPATPRQMEEQSARGTQYCVPLLFIYGG